MQVCDVVRRRLQHLNAFRYSFYILNLILNLKEIELKLDFKSVKSTFRLRLTVLKMSLEHNLNSFLVFNEQSLFWGVMAPR